MIQWILCAIIGLVDVDIHGPSLPILVKLDDYTVRRSPLGSGMILPLSHQGVKMISLGFVSPKVCAHELTKYINSLRAFSFQSFEFHK